MAEDALAVEEIDLPESPARTTGANASPSATAIRETREVVFIDWTSRRAESENADQRSSVNGSS